MEAKLFISENGKVECECDAAALYGECRHLQSEKVIAYLVARVQSAEATLAQKIEEVDALSSILHNSAA